jgi:hypothetical protein
MELLGTFCNTRLKIAFLHFLSSLSSHPPSWMACIQCAMNETLIAAVECNNEIKKNVVCTYFPLLFIVVLPIGST